MNRIAKFTASLLVLTSLSGAMTGVCAYDAEEGQRKTNALTALNVFSDDYKPELNQTPTRMEAVEMIIRLLGDDAKAIWGSYENPFTDTPETENAGKYLAYAYSTGLIKGVSDTSFDPQGKVDAQTFTTMLLRALGYVYDDNSVWENWKTLGTESTILSDGIDIENFKLGDAVVMAYSALDAKMNKSDDTLAKYLIANYKLSDITLAQAQIAEGKKVTLSSGLSLILASLYNGADTISADRLRCMKLDDDNLNYLLGLDKLDYVEGIAAEPMMSSIAHSVCLVKVADGTDIDSVKAAIKKGINPNKWICVGVEPENIRVESIGNLILVVMDSGAPDKIVSNFYALEK